MKTIREISEERSLDRSTLLKAAQRGEFGTAAHQSGATWLIDDESLNFQAWYIKHQMRGETTIRVETPEPPEWVDTWAGKHAWKVDLKWRANAAQTTDQDSAMRRVLLREADTIYNR